MKARTASGLRSASHVFASDYTFRLDSRAAEGHFVACDNADFAQVIAALDFIVELEKEFWILLYPPDSETKGVPIGVIAGRKLSSETLILERMDVADNNKKFFTLLLDSFFEGEEA